MWGIIEGLQVVEHFGLFDTKAPGNVGTFLDKIGMVSNMSVAEIESDKFMYFPERDAFSI